MFYQHKHGLLIISLIYIHRKKHRLFGGFSTPWITWPLVVSEFNVDWYLKQRMNRIICAYSVVWYTKHYFKNDEISVCICLNKVCRGAGLHQDSYRILLICSVTAAQDKPFRSFWWHSRFIFSGATFCKYLSCFGVLFDALFSSSIFLC